MNLYPNYPLMSSAKTGKTAPQTAFSAANLAGGD